MRAARDFLQRHYLLAIPLILSLYLHFYHFGQTEIFSDSALNSFRALGWFDYFGPGQEGPIQWLGSTPWWTKFSFQDAPPLSFALQHISFSLFGDTAAAAQLPFLIAGVITLVVIYFYVLRLKGRAIAFWSSLAFSVSSFALFSCLSGYIEGIEILFVILAFLSFALFLKEDAISQLYVSVVATGLALLSKYTAVFIIPSLLIASLTSRSSRKLTTAHLRRYRREYILATALFLVVLTPVIIYNSYLLVLRGRFDTALAAMFGLPNDLSRTPSFNFFSNEMDVVRSLWMTSSFPFITSCILSVGWMLRKSWEDMRALTESTLNIFLFFLTGMFGFMGGGTRWLPLFIPFLCIAFGITVVDIYKRYSRTLILVLGGCIIAFEFLYALNTHIFSTLLGGPELYSVNTREESRGFNQLDAYLRAHFSPLPSRQNPESFSSLDALQGGYADPTGTPDSSQDVVFYDNEIDWFSGWWYIERYRIYYREPIYPIATRLPTTFSHPITFIYPLRADILSASNASSYGGREIDRVTHELDGKKVPSSTINDAQGNPAFRIYVIPANFELISP